jgi:hypothetical protein
MEQLVRDARIAQIYEGANGIHALDLVGRKLPLHEGRLIKRFLYLLEGFVEAHNNDERMTDFIVPLSKSIGLLRQSTDWIASAAARDPDETGAASHDYLRLLALTAMGWMWARSAKVALDGLAGDNTGFYADKLMTGRFFVKRVLPQTSSLTDTLMAGAECLMEMQADRF